MTLRDTKVLHVVKSSSLYPLMWGGYPKKMHLVARG